MSFFRVMDVAASGLAAQRMRMETVASNLANASTTRTPEGGPYRRRDVVFEASPAAGTPRSPFEAALRQVRVAQVAVDPNPPQLRYEPAHPDADPQGFVGYPNVEPVAEMVNLLGAARSYEANLTVMEATKSLLLRALEI
ncbi:MAG: flagellar basal body rod protein FlgC [Deferrisomatales bacterium]